MARLKHDWAELQTGRADLTWPAYFTTIRASGRGLLIWAFLFALDQVEIECIGVFIQINSFV